MVGKMVGYWVGWAVGSVMKGVRCPPRVPLREPLRKLFFRGGEPREPLKKKKGFYESDSEVCVSTAGLSLFRGVHGVHEAKEGNAAVSSASREAVSPRTSTVSAVLGGRAGWFGRELEGAIDEFERADAAGVFSTRREPG